VYSFNPTTNNNRQRHEWEIDPSKLIIKTVIARGTFGTVHRGIYDGQDVAGQLYHHHPISILYQNLFTFFLSVFHFWVDLQF